LTSIDEVWCVVSCGFVPGPRTLSLPECLNRDKLKL